MNKDTKRELKDRARTILEDKDFAKFEYYLENELWTNLRVLMSDITDMYDLRVMLERNTLAELIELQDVESIIIDCSLGIYEDTNEERERDKFRVKRTS